MISVGRGLEEYEIGKLGMCLCKHAVAIACLSTLHKRKDCRPPPTELMSRKTSASVIRKS